MVKLKAFLVHFCGSAVVLFTFLSMVFFIWYPEPYFQLEGIARIIIVLLLVDLVAGPVLTGIVYKPGKKSLVFDISMILIAQIAFLSYGMYTIYSERPQYIVFNEDRFFTVQASAIDQEKVPTEVANTAFFARPKLIFNLVPKDPKIKVAIITQMFDGGKRMHEHVEFYRPYNTHSKDIRQAKAQSLDYVVNNYPAAKKVLEKLKIDKNIKDNQLLFFSIAGKFEQGTLILDKNTTQPIGFIMK